MGVHGDLAEGENGHDGVRNYISWEDLKVDEQRLTLKRHEDVGVIVVNKYGGGHSTTVQGAVDMVPDDNQNRVKIYIYPGIYRSVITRIICMVALVLFFYQNWSFISQSM